MSTENNQPLKEFSQFHLDFRLVRAIAKMGINNPTEIQNQVIPLALQGKDILARAKTGSGKTLAYGAPIIQSILSKMSNAAETASNKGIQALILVPTSELSFQVAEHLSKLTLYTSEIKIVNVISKNQLENKQANISQLDPAVKSQLKEIPHVVIGTPNKILELVNTKVIDIKTSLTHLAIDEADLILSFGYFDDLKSLVPNLPNPCQTYLMSATLPPDLKDLNSLILTNPAIIHLKDSDDRGQLTEYQFPCNGDDKYLLLYVILKLKLIKGRCIIFVNVVDRAYQIKLFLEKFGIKTCILNSELPLNSRYHIIQEFNRGKYDYIIATDEYKPAESTEIQKDDGEVNDETKVVDDEPSKDNEDDEVEVKEEDNNDELPDESDESDESDDGETSKVGETTDATKDSKPKKKKQKKQKQKQKYDAVTGTYGVSRGVDFQNVAAVINFDFPSSAENYTHRVGRTARGGKKGMSLSLVVNDDPEELVIASQVMQSREQLGAKVQPFKFDMSQIEGFRYRAHDAMRAVTKTHVKEARLNELKEQILNSDKLQSHFEDRPQDLEFLRHDLPLLPKTVQSHLKHVPQYLLPKIQEVTSEGASLGKRASDETSLGPIQFNKSHFKKFKQNRGKNKKLDPLKSFTKKFNNKKPRK